jgi:hypothetical protein
LRACDTQADSLTGLVVALDPVLLSFAIIHPRETKGTGNSLQATIAARFSPAVRLLTTVNRTPPICVRSWVTKNVGALRFL